MAYSTSISISLTGMNATEDQLAERGVERPCVRPNNNLRKLNGFRPHTGNVIGYMQSEYDILLCTPFNVSRLGWLRWKFIYLFRSRSARVQSMYCRTQPVAPG